MSWQAEAGSTAGWFMCSVRYSYTVGIQHCDNIQQFHLYSILFILPFLVLTGLHSIWWQSVWSSCTEDLQGKQTWDPEVCVCTCMSVPIYVCLFVCLFCLSFSSTHLNVQHLNVLCSDYGPGHDSWSSGHRVERLWWSSDPGRSRVFGWIRRYIPGMVIL